jgi:hypothetical protein
MKKDLSRIREGMIVDLQCFHGCKNTTSVILGKEIKPSSYFFGEDKIWFKPDTERRIFELKNSDYCTDCAITFSFAVFVHYKKVIKGCERIIMFGHPTAGVNTLIEA